MSRSPLQAEVSQRHGCCEVELRARFTAFFWVFLRKRADFLKAARARRQGTSSFLLQGRKRGEGEPDGGIRVGYTCSKKVGNAVFRNHAKRRLREAAREVIPELGREGWDYVLIGKKTDTSARPFDLLLKDLKYAMRKVHGDTR